MQPKKSIILLSFSAIHSAVITSRFPLLQIIYLNVMQPPKLVHQENYNGSVIISEGETLSLDCNAHGIPIPRIYWMYGKHAQSKFKQSNLSCESKIGFNASLLLNTYINSVCSMISSRYFALTNISVEKCSTTWQWKVYLCCKKWIST